MLLGFEAGADDYDLGREAYLAGDFQKALDYWSRLANAGDPRAQFGVGTLYYEGKGVALDLSHSAQWFRKAAEQGYPPAQFNLGNAYKHGRGVALDDRQASAWWLKAAEQEFAPAQYNLGTQYYFGRGVEKNQQEALRWYRRAADNGHSRAVELIASIDADGTPDELVEQPRAETSSGVTWLMKQPADSYIIQLLATPNEDSVHKLLARHGIGSQSTVLPFLRNNEPWYAVLYGIYASRADADQAVQGLPPELRDAPPWIRAVGDVQRIAAPTQ